MSNVRVRFPPSPTGYCHVGTARMAIVNFLFARAQGGVIVFRSEDTDRERSSREYEDDIKESFTWLGLSWDEFYRQSERADMHAAKLRALIDADKAYISEEESKKEPGSMVKVVRLRNPGTTITFTDILRGDITFDTTDLGDFAIARAADDPLYHFAVVVDDAEMGITHVIRGEDHISNTPRQILIQEALGYPRPQYAHYPLHLAADRSKLSKRKGDVAVRDYRAKGYLSEALLNYLALLGWTPPSGREIMALEDMLGEFKLTDLHTSGAVFDVEKLRWFNREYLGRMTDDAFAKSALPILQESLAMRVLWNEDVGRALLPIMRERVSAWEDIRTHVGDGEYDYFFAPPALDPVSVPEKKSSPAEAREHLQSLAQLLTSIDEAQFTAESTKSAVWDYASEKGRGAVLWPLRYSLSGREKSPDPFAIAGIIGKQETLSRISAAHVLLA